MYSTGPSGGDIVFMIIVALIALAALWFIIQTAVKSGTTAALHQYDHDKRIAAKNYDSEQ